MDFLQRWIDQYIRVFTSAMADGDFLALRPHQLQRPLLFKLRARSGRRHTPLAR
jgi:hypothetical protein